MATLLEIDGLSRNFGGLAAVADLRLSVQRGELLGLIGPNGAGKTTVFNLISGVIPPSIGRVVFKGAEITGRPAYAIVRLGLARTFQIPTLFSSFSTLDNVVLGTYPQRRRRPLDVVLARRASIDDGEAHQRAIELLRLLRLDGARDEQARNLPHGDQKKVELAVALACRPELLLLDEPFAGLSADEIEDMAEHIERLRREGMTFVVVEHNMRALMRLADRVCVLNFGQKIAEGTPREIAENPEVIRAYLGTKRHAAGG
ncbi:MAG TPA: ABC transporter ATP-binding protein [Candidatus Methylomirabilis sp.]|nr:ABC transporter ATP-binding protein [Candidatus Methylomirabilis sp.]